MDYLCVATFRKVGIERRIALSLKDSLYDLALLLFGSLVCTEVLEDYQFEFVFGEDRYITRKDEQESLFGYSTDHYHILDDETLQNAIVRKAASACFKIFSCGRQDDIVLEMDIGELHPAYDKHLPMLLCGEGIIGKEYSIQALSSDDVREMMEKNVPILRKKYGFKQSDWH